MSPWGGLLGKTFGTVIVLALLLLLARRFVRSWWIPGATILFALAVLLQFVSPYANRIGTHPVRSPSLKAAITRLEAREHAGHPVVRVAPVHDSTTAANHAGMRSPGRGIIPRRPVTVHGKAAASHPSWFDAVRGRLLQLRNTPP